MFKGSEIFKTTKVEINGFKIEFKDIDFTVPPFGSSTVIESRVKITDSYENTISFPFWGSIADYEAIISGQEAGPWGRLGFLSFKERVKRNKERHSEYNVIWAAYCALTDALAYDNAQNIDDFAAELGYENPSEAKRVYNGCKEAFDKWSGLELPEGIEDLYDLANHWQEEYEL